MQSARMRGRRNRIDGDASRPPDVVVLDLMMPVLDGFGVLAAMRADPMFAGIPVVVLTAERSRKRSVSSSREQPCACCKRANIVSPTSRRSCCAQPFALKVAVADDNEVASR